MFRLIFCICVQSVLLVAAQSFLKISLELFGKFSFTWQYFKTVFTTWQFAVSGLCALSAMFLWMYVLKNFPFSVAYPLLSLSYVIGLLVGYFVFHEAVPFTRWLGVFIILVGVYLVIK